MNYGKKGASKRQKQIASKSNMKKKRVGVRVFKALVACLLLVIVLGAVGGQRPAGPDPLLVHLAPHGGGAGRRPGLLPGPGPGP